MTMVRNSQIIKGVLLILVSDAVFCLMGVMIRYAHEIDSYSKVFFRFVIGLSILAMAAMAGKIKLKFVAGKLLFARGLLGSCAVFIFYLSIMKLGLAKGTILTYSYPIFASIFGAILLKEKIGTRNAVAILAAFAGIYLLAMKERAGFSFVAGFGKYEFLAVLGAILSGMACVIIKKLHDTDDTYAIYFAQCVMGFWLFLVPANVTQSHVGLTGVGLLIGIGLTATVGQLFMTQGFKYLPVQVSTLLGMVVPILNYFVGVTFFDEVVALRSVVGSVIVLSSCVVVLRGKKNGN